MNGIGHNSEGGAMGLIIKNKNIYGLGVGIAVTVLVQILFFHMNFNMQICKRVLSEARIAYEYNVNKIYRRIHSTQHMLLTNHLLRNCAENRI